MILIGRNLSAFTRRVAVTMQLLDLPFERRELTAWSNLDELRRINPIGRVPALILDDGEVVFDSSAILDYIDELVGPQRALMPSAGAPRREVMRLTVAALGGMEKAAAVRYELVMRPEGKIHEPWLNHNKDQVRSALQWLEQQVKGPWITGESLTQADVSTVVFADFLRVFDATLMPAGSYPALEGVMSRAAELAPFASTRPT